MFLVYALTLNLFYLFLNRSQNFFSLFNSFIASIALYIEYIVSARVEINIIDCINGKLEAIGYVS